jgi:type VI secretion system protein ImpC
MAEPDPGAENPLDLVIAATEAARAAPRAGDGAGSADLARVEDAIARLLATILSHPRFVALEAAWRSLHRFVLAQEAAPVVVKLLPATKREIVRDQRAVADPEDSDLAALLWAEGLGGGAPFGLLLADLEFDAGPEDVRALRGLASAGEGGFVPVLAHAAPALLDLDAWPALPGKRDLARVHEGPAHAAWRSLRESGEARFLALVGPRVLACDGPGVPRWTGGAWVLAARMAAAFRNEGWAAAIEGRDHGTESGLPPRGAIPTECDPGERAAALAALGLVALVPRGADRAAVLAAPSLHRPPRYHAPAATADAALAAGLPWVLGMGRFLHGLAIRARHELDRGHGVPAAAQALNTWLRGYCQEDGPLAEASVELPPAQGHPGVHLLAARLRPRLPQGTPAAAHKILLNLP